LLRLLLAGEQAVVWGKCETGPYEVLDVGAHQRPGVLARGGHVGGVVGLQLVFSEASRQPEH
jgi:hypothetical protein